MSHDLVDAVLLYFTACLECSISDHCLVFFFPVCILTIQDVITNPDKSFKLLIGTESSLRTFAPINVFTPTVD